MDFDYLLMNDIMQMLKNYDAKILRNERAGRCLVEFEITKRQANRFLQEINNRHTLKNKFEIKIKADETS